MCDFHIDFGSYFAQQRHDGKREKQYEQKSSRKKVEKILLKQYQFISYFYPVCVRVSAHTSYTRRRQIQAHTDTNTISFSFCLMYTCFIITRLWYFFRCWLNEWFEIRIEARKKAVEMRWDEDMRRETNKNNNKWKANKQRASNKMSNVNPLNKSIHSIEKWGCEHQKMKNQHDQKSTYAHTHTITRHIIASRVCLNRTYPRPLRCVCVYIFVHIKSAPSIRQSISMHASENTLRILQ